mmetsp:Transcript_2732/g.8036  ORF Transcript_2732/g.8036 Transcript_2732/m.8036 type:complete len:290 (+) Transcript_2732:1652-2521(+)
MAALAIAGMTPPAHFCSAVSSSSAVVVPSSASTRVLYFFTNASLSSVSTPNSFLIVLSCSFNKNVRCCEESFVSTCCEISCWSLESSRSRDTSSKDRRSRATTSRSSSAACRSSPGAVARLAAKSANLNGSAMSTRCVKYCMCSRYSGFSWTSSRIAATISFDSARTRSPRDASSLTARRLRALPLRVGGRGFARPSPFSSSSTQASRGQCDTPSRGGGPASTTVAASTRRWTSRSACAPPSGASAMLWTCANAPTPCTSSSASSRSAGLKSSAAASSSAAFFRRKSAT